MRIFPHHRLIAAGSILALLAISGQASAQDLLRMFLPGDPQYQLMGGNPFSTMRADGNGYSGAPTDSRMFVRYDGRFDGYYSELRTDGSSPSLDGQTHSLTFQLPLRTGARFGLTAQSRQLLSEARNTSDQLLNYDNSLRRIRLSYESPLFQSIRWNATLGHSNASSSLFQDIGTSILIQMPAGALSLNVERSSNSQELNLAVAGVQGFLPLDHQNLTVKVGLASGGSTPRITVSGFQTTVSPLPRSVDRDLLRFEPAGFVKGWELRLETPVVSSWKGMITMEGLAFAGDGIFTAAGSRYGQLKNAEYRDVSASAGLMTAGPSGSMFVADFKWMRVDGSFTGYAESWPFVSALESFISQRGSFQVAGSFSLSQFHAGGLMAVARWLELGAGITAMRIVPALRIESWQPGFLGVGRKAYADRQLSIDRIDGAMLSGGFRLHAGNIRVDYSISQFVPVALRKSEPLDGATDLFTAPEPGSVIRSWGGLFQRMSVEVEM